ncbi:alcohol dehydrogenase catalytic domain-containing protein [Sphaerochaeta globosa]|uniref:alcohol dehydrogenase catalytic domain-containing protein n=1 Tax=Sphaerochaeta globosa TaxID=1131703 RepID=UPI0009D6E354
MKIKHRSKSTRIVSKHAFTKYPVTQGHEVSGMIVAVGKDVKGLFEGQKVTIEPQIVCGKCYPCEKMRD